MEKKIRDVLESIAENKWSCAFILVFLFFFYNYFYSDILITTSHSINFWNAVFPWDIRNFYEIAQSDIRNEAYTIYLNPGYDFPIYVLFGIWNFPLWLLRELAGLDIWNSSIALMWAKSIILFFTVLCCISIKKICVEINQEKDYKTAILFFLTSLYLYAGAVVNSQYDIIVSFFMLEALYHIIKGERKKFIFYIAVSVGIKPFSLFIFVPLILYAEKNLLKIILQSIITIVPYVFLKVFIPNNIQTGTYGNVLTLFKNKIRIGTDDIPIFLLACFVFWLICYGRRSVNRESFARNCIQMCYIAFALFFMLCGTSPYWIVMLAPFQCLLFVTNKKYLCFNVILEMVSSICIIGTYIIKSPWCYDVRLVRSSLLAKLCGMRFDTTDNILDLVHNISAVIYDNLDKATYMLFGIFFACSAVSIWLNVCAPSNVVFENEDAPKFVFAIRTAVCLGVCMLPLAAYIL